MKIDSPDRTLFYQIEKAILEYRKKSQENIAQYYPDLLLEEALILLIIDEHDEVGPTKLAQLLFKDLASMTRQIQSMQKKAYITKVSCTNDKRRSILKLTDQGTEMLNNIRPIIRANRLTALAGINEEDMNTTAMVLQKIISNSQIKLYI